MQRLSAVDALFVDMETKRMHNSVVAVLIVDRNATLITPTLVSQCH